jgi:hypothetical protein
VKYLIGCKALFNLTIGIGLSKTDLPMGCMFLGFAVVDCITIWILATRIHP